MSIVAKLVQDAAANYTTDRSGNRRERFSLGALPDLLTLRYLAVLLFRASQLAGRHSGVMASLVKQLNQLLTGADVAWQARIGSGLVLRHPVGVVVGMGVVAGERLVLQQGVTIGGSGASEFDDAHFPTLGDQVRIGPGARLLGNVSVGDGAIIGANSVVIRNVRPKTFVAGVPAREVRAL
jgi:serine O-acetyltransferase